MTSPNDDTPRLTPEERDFVKRLAEHYSPPPMTPSQRITFDEALQSRLSGRRTWMFKPVVVGVTVAVFGILFVLLNVIEPELTGRKATAPPVVRETASQRETVGDVLLGFAFDEPNGLDTDEWLPENYVAISILLNDG